MEELPNNLSLQNGCVGGSSNVAFDILNEFGDGHHPPLTTGHVGYTPNPNNFNDWGSASALNSYRALEATMGKDGNNHVGSVYSNEHHLQYCNLINDIITPADKANGGGPEGPRPNDSILGFDHSCPGVSAGPVNHDPHGYESNDGLHTLREEVDVGETLHMTEMFLDEILNEPDKRMEDGRVGQPYDDSGYGFAESGCYNLDNTLRCQADVYRYDTPTHFDPAYQNAHDLLMTSVRDEDILTGLSFRNGSSLFKGANESGGDGINCAQFYETGSQDPRDNHGYYREARLYEYADGSEERALNKTYANRINYYPNPYHNGPLDDGRNFERMVASDMSDGNRRTLESGENLAMPRLNVYTHLRSDCKNPSSLNFNVDPTLEQTNFGYDHLSYNVPTTALILNHDALGGRSSSITAWNYYTTSTTNAFSTIFPGEQPPIPSNNPGYADQLPSSKNGLTCAQLQLLASTYPTFSKARRLTVKELLTSARDKKLMGASKGAQSTSVGVSCEAGVDPFVGIKTPPTYNPHQSYPYQAEASSGLQNAGLDDLYPHSSIKTIQGCSGSLPQATGESAFWMNYDFSGTKRPVKSTGPKRSASSYPNGKRIRDGNSSDSRAATSFTSPRSKRPKTLLHKPSSIKAAKKKKIPSNAPGLEASSILNTTKNRNEVLCNGMPPLHAKFPKIMLDRKRSPSSLIHWEPTYDESSNSVYGDDPYLNGPLPNFLFPAQARPLDYGSTTESYENFLEDLLHSEPFDESRDDDRLDLPYQGSAENMGGDLSCEGALPTPVKASSLLNQAPSTRSRHFEFSQLCIGNGFRVDSNCHAFTSTIKNLNCGLTRNGSAVPSKACHFKMKVLVAQRKILYEFPLILTENERLSLIQSSTDPISLSDDNPVSFITNVEIDFKFIEQFTYKDPSLVIEVSCLPRIRIVYKVANNPACYTKYSLQNPSQINFLHPLTCLTSTHHEIIFKRSNTLEKFRAYVTNLYKCFPQLHRQIQQESGSIYHQSVAECLTNRGTFSSSTDVPYSPNITLYEGIDSQWYGHDSTSYNAPITSPIVESSDHYQGMEYPKYAIEYETWGTQETFYGQDKQNFVTVPKSPNHLEPGTSPNSPQRQPKHDDLNAKRKRLEAVAFRFAKDYCKCTSGCNTLRCICVKTGSACSASQEHNCQCVDCHNPLNSLRDEMASGQSVWDSLNTEVSLNHNGLSSYTDLEAKYGIARSDICLMQNIYQVANLKIKLNTLVKLSCCGTLTVLKRCIPGTVNCPNSGHCRAKFKYSWCLGIFFDEINNPRNHCEICRRCVNKSYQHCYKCNRCYVAGQPARKCTNCYPPSIPSVDLS